MRGKDEGKFAWQGVKFGGKCKSQDGSNKVKQIPSDALAHS